MVRDDDSNKLGDGDEPESVLYVINDVSGDERGGSDSKEGLTMNLTREVVGGDDDKPDDKPSCNGSHEGREDREETMGIDNSEE
jgi:hypothetical protein